MNSLKNRPKCNTQHHQNMGKFLQCKLFLLYLSLVHFHFAFQYVPVLQYPFKTCSPDLTELKCSVSGVFYLLIENSHEECLNRNEKNNENFRKYLSTFLRQSRKARYEWTQIQFISL